MLLLSQKVDKVDGKGLSTHDYDDAARDLLHTLSNELNNKVDKVEGKGLSTFDFSNAYKNKLDGIENGAQANVIEEIRLFNVPLTITGKAVNLDLSGYYYSKSETDSLLSGKEDKSNKVTSISSESTDTEYPSAKATHDAIKQALSNVYKFQGTMTVSQLNALVKDASMNGFVYNVADDGNLTVLMGGLETSVSVVAGDNVALVYTDENNINWDKLAGTFTVDLSHYYTKAQSDAIYGRKDSSNTWTGSNQLFSGNVKFNGGAEFNSNLTFSGVGKIFCASPTNFFVIDGRAIYSFPYSSSGNYTLATTSMLSWYLTKYDLFSPYYENRRYLEGDVVWEEGYAETGLWRCIHDTPNPAGFFDEQEYWEFLGNVQDLLMDHEDRITALENASPSPSANVPPIDIEILEMKIIQDGIDVDVNAPQFRCRYDYVDNTDDRMRNDPKFAYLHIKSSFIDDYAEQQIREGNFIIRFDYPTFYRANSRKMKGNGRYSFVKNLYMGENGSYLDIAGDIERSFLYIQQTDIKTDSRGRKFIYKKIPIVDVLNHLWKFNDFGEVTEATDNYFDYDEGFLDQVRVGGAVQTHSDTFFEGPSRLRDSGTVKYGYTDFSFNLHSGVMNFGQAQAYKSPNKDAMLLHYWAPFMIPHETKFSTIFTRSQYRRNHARNEDMNGGMAKIMKFTSEAVVKPRFAILDPDYDIVEGNDSMWVKKYPQYKKRLYCYPAQLFDSLINYEEEDFDVVIFRFGISK